MIGDEDDVPCVSRFTDVQGVVLTALRYSSTLLDAEVTTANDPVPVSTTVPLTIICGFLGAGKSTLVRYGLLQVSFLKEERSKVLSGAYCLNTMDIA